MGYSGLRRPGMYGRRSENAWWTQRGGKDGCESEANSGTSRYISPVKGHSGGAASCADDWRRAAAEFCPWVGNEMFHSRSDSLPLRSSLLLSNIPAARCQLKAGNARIPELTMAPHNIQQFRPSMHLAQVPLNWKWFLQRHASDWLADLAGAFEAS